MYLKVISNTSNKVSLSSTRKKKIASGLQLRMFHVGQGECVLVVFPGKEAWLVDCGRVKGKDSNEKLAEDLIDYLEKNKLFLKAILLSHPHSDHARAITHLISLKTKSVAYPVKIFRSDDKGWNNKKSVWLKPYREAVASFAKEVVVKRNKRKRVKIEGNVYAHLFTSGTGATKNYQSLFMQLRYHEAKMLFTGDAYKRYETAMLERFGKKYFAADMLKITHHGSKGGTDKDVLAKIQPGIAIVSTSGRKGHDLHKNTRKTIKSQSQKIRIFETTARASSGKLSARDVVIETDGKQASGNAIFYRVRRLARKFKN